MLSLKVPYPELFLLKEYKGLFFYSTIDYQRGEFTYE